MLRVRKLIYILLSFVLTVWIAFNIVGKLVESANLSGTGSNETTYAATETTAPPKTIPPTTVPSITTIPTQLTTAPTEIPESTDSTETVPAETRPPETDPSVPDPTDATEEPAPTEPEREEEVPVSYKTVDETVYANRDINVRSGPGKEHDKLGSLAYGQSIQRIGIGDNGWSKVIYDGQEGYVYSTYVSVTKPVSYKTVDETVYINRGVNVRSGPGKEHEKLGSLVYGQSIQRIGIGDNGWSKVLFDGQEAYIYSSYLSTTKPPEYTTEDSGDTLTEQQKAILRVIESNSVKAKLGYCQAWVADVYYMAGTGPRASRCCATHAGVAWGTSNDWSKIQVGATVYGYSSSVYGHVGIYIGDGKVAHNAGYVKIDTLEDWIATYNGKCWGWNGGYNLTGNPAYDCKPSGTFMKGKH